MTPGYLNMSLRELDRTEWIREIASVAQQWMTTDGLWKPNGSPVARVHPPRRRRACLEEPARLLQRGERVLSTARTKRTSHRREFR